jgi:Ca2+-binding EF-hand superfamily protein
MMDWLERENLTVSEAFKIIDSDFDGLIGRKDLILFCKNVLKMKRHDLSSTKITRLFKLLDFHNRKNI